MTDPTKMIDGRRMGKQASVDMALGRWIRENPGKPFALATSEGVYSYNGTFTSHADIQADYDKQEKIKQRFTYDEVGVITPEMIELLRRHK